MLFRSILFISHDRYFINKISNRVIAIEEEGLQSYLGNYDYYKSIKDKERQQEKELAAKEEKKADKSVKPAKPINRKPDGGKKTVKNSVEAAARVEKRIGELETELSEIDEMMLAMGADYEELSKLYERKEGVSKELEEAMEDWLEGKY